MADDNVSAVKTVAEVESSQRGIVSRWTTELAISDDTEENFRKTGDEIWMLYKSKSQKANSFNILWSNSETLRPALYNSTPNPDVRRRFRDADPLGKVGSTVLQRGLTYLIDAYDFDLQIKRAALDVLLPGRGVARIKYVPAFEGDSVVDESAPCAHVKWNDFRRGPGNSWDEVQWVAFRHVLQFEDLVKQFGEEMAARVPLQETIPSDKGIGDEETRALLKTAEVWEIWDKAQKRVLFICKEFSDSPLAVIDDPLRLDDFLPVPRPLYAIEDTTTLVPDSLYKRYEIQAEELNKVSRRIDRIVAALKVRGAYSAHLTELKTVIESGDNAMIPITNASEVANMGGLDKAIWIMPIDKLALVLEQLYVAREKIIQTIYEITGLGDIMRGVTNPHETLGAQQLKSQWGSLRLQNLQRELQRFIRDLLRLMGEVMAKHFSPKTLQAMTGVQLPSVQDKQKMQMAIHQAQSSGQQMPPDMSAQIQKAMSVPTWDDVMQLFKSDKMRLYRIDIETDSTVAETIQRDSEGMMNTLSAVSKIFTELAPAIQGGYMSVDVAKSLALAMARVSKAGQAVEDAIEQIEQPPPAPPQQDNSVEVAKVKAQSDQQMQQADHAHEQQMVQVQAAIDAQVTQMQEQFKQQTAAMQAHFTQQTAAMQSEMQVQQTKMLEEAKSQRELIKAQMDQHAAASQTMFEGAVKIIVAQIAAKQKAEAAEAAAEREVVKAETSEG